MAKKNNKQYAKAKSQNTAGKIVMWILATLMLLFVGYCVACLIGAAVTPDATFSEYFTTFFGLATQAPAPVVPDPETTASLMI